MHRVVPDATLILCLRNPIERVHSVYFYHQRNGEMLENFEVALEKYGRLLDQNRYWTLMSNYLEFFGESQVEILFYQDLNERPQAFARQLCNAIGVDPAGIDEEPIESQINVGGQARHCLLGKIASMAASLLRTTGNHAVLDWLKGNDLVRSLVLRRLWRDEKNVVSSSIREKLLQEYEPEIRKIEQFTGRDLRKWREKQDSDINPSV
ncbi:sulfotransferase domain-containing protein [Salinibacter ruber]|uniref:sulfotransferase domain-containing protein n=1 Tax=Salinibacter ruber TaxID=146919 RepID=UPI000DD667BC|nr:sulfotransferase domain-containing protein [Salinibacter ruber]